MIFFKLLFSFYLNFECFIIFIKIYTREGHLKTSSIPYDLHSADSYVHLTNYSVQKYNKEFSKFEQGNEVSFNDFQVKNFYDKK